jgi:2-polyprenyl-6-methoxyphenol hydroxylase-like FAD-dependent oxidoreductase
MRLAQYGYRVLCLDRAVFPKDTISTHYIRQVGLAKLRDWGLLEALKATNCTPIRRITTSYRDVSFSGFSDPILGITETYAPRRIVLDQVLQDGARSVGVEIRDGFTVSGLVRSGAQVTGVTGQDRDGAEVTERARLVIGADGSSSTVAGLVAAQAYNVVAANTFIYYSYWRDVDVNCQTHIGDMRMVGAWPTNNGQTLVWVMLPRARFAEFRTDTERNFHAALRQTAPDLFNAVESGTRAEQFYGARYPDNFYRVSHGPGWALVGDAGYHKDPFTGLGISDAFIYADALAQRAHEGLAGTRPLIEALADYQRARDAETKSIYEFTCTASTFVLPPGYVKMLRALPSSPDHARQWFRMMGGGLSGREFFAADNMRSLMEAAA